MNAVGNGPCEVESPRSSSRGTFVSLMIVVTPSKDSWIRARLESQGTDLEVLCSSFFFLG